MRTGNIDRGYPFIAMVIGLWAWNPLIVSQLGSSLPILEVDFFATLFAAAVLAMIITARREWRVFRSYTAGEYGTMALIGAVGIFPYTLLYYFALALSPGNSGDVNIINYLWPILTLVFSSVVLRERLTLVKAAAVVLSFCGVVLLISAGRGAHSDGVVFSAYAAAACGALFWALFSVLTKRFPFNALASMFAYNLVAALLFGAVSLFVSPYRMPSLQDWGLLAALGGVVNGLGYLFWILALRVGSTARMTSAVYLVPFGALVCLSVFGKEAIHLTQIASLMLVLAGPLMLQLIPSPSYSSRGPTYPDR